MNKLGLLKTPEKRILKTKEFFCPKISEQIIKKCGSPKKIYSFNKNGSQKVSSIFPNKILRHFSWLQVASSSIEVSRGRTRHPAPTFGHSSADSRSCTASEALLGRGLWTEKREPLVLGFSSLKRKVVVFWTWQQNAVKKLRWNIWKFTSK